MRITDTTNHLNCLRPYRKPNQKSKGSVYGKGIALAGLILGYLPDRCFGIWNLHTRFSVWGKMKLVKSLGWNRRSLRGVTVDGHTYYVFVSEIEVYLTTQMETHGFSQNVQTSNTVLCGRKPSLSKRKDDSLIADWSGLSLDFDWSDLEGKTISTDEVIKAARIRNEKEGVIELVVEDEDEDAVDDDMVGRIEIKLDELKVGLNKRKLSKTQTNAIKRIYIQVLPQGASLKELVDLMR